MNDRPVARLVACLAILVLGAMAAYRLELGYLPSLSFPELTVQLRAPEPMEVDELTRLYVQPLESAIRAIGNVTSMAGDVDDSSATLQVRFQAGTDAERKAARLESELVTLRRQLPMGTSLGVWPAGQGGGDFSVFLWLDQSSGDKIGSTFIEAVRALPEVRDVQVAGRDRQELRLTSTGKAAPSEIERALAGHLAVHQLGETTANGRRRSVLVRGNSDTSFQDLALRQGEALLPLTALADVRLVDQEAFMVVHVQGRQGLVLIISRELESSPLALERALRRTLDRFALDGRWRFIRSEAEPLQELLQRLTWGFLVAIAVTTALAGLLGGWRAAISQALALPVALAAALNAFWLAGLSLDVTTLPMLAVALGWCLFFPAFRAGRQGLVAACTMMAAAMLLPIAVSLASGSLAALFQAPTRAFLCAQLAGMVALAVLPLPPVRDQLLGLGQRRWMQPASVGRPLRSALRNPWTVLLATVTVTYALLVLFGGALAPRTGSLSPVTSDLRVGLSFAEGTTPAQAEAQVSLAERELSKRPEITDHWSYFNRRQASIDASVRPKDRSPEDLRPLADRLRVTLNALGASVNVRVLASGSGQGGEPVRFSDSLETLAETDSGASFYRFVLRATDLKVLRKVHSGVVERLSQQSRIRRDQIRSDWRRPGVRLELVPRPGTTPAEIRAGTALLRQRSALPRSRELPTTAEIDLRIVDPDAPQTFDDVHQRADIMGTSRSSQGTVTAASHLFEVRQILSSPGIQRQSGRYVLPVTVRFFSFLRRVEDRETVDRVLRSLAMPAGCDLELPRLSADPFSTDRRRMLGIAATLPLLLWALAVTRLNSLWRGLLVLAPLALGVAATTPWIKASKGHVDEMMLFALGAMAVGGAPLAMQILAAAARTTAPDSARNGRDYRWLLRHALLFLVSTVGMVLLLAVPGLGIDADYHPWVLPMRLAAVAGAFNCLGCCFCLPSLLRSVAHFRQRGARARRRQATRDTWRAPGPLQLEVRGLVKTYGNGFQALRGVDFHLEPGIIGLLGPNGAGKTTLLRTLCGLLEPTRGNVLYRGVPVTPENLPEYRRLVGFLPQDFNAYSGFTGAQFLDYWALEKGLRDARERRDEVERWLSQVGLEDAAERKVREYSGGMRRRIGIARALLGDPPIVIVDEPTTGLDVSSRNRLRESLLRVAGERVILFSTHIASDIAAAAARILLLHNGGLLYDGPSSGLIELARGSVFEAMVSDTELREFSHRYRVTTRVRTLDGIRVRAVASGDEAPPGRVVEPNLEEAYLVMVGGQGWKRQQGGLTGSLLDLNTWRQVA